MLIPGKEYRYRGEIVTFKCLSNDRRFAFCYPADEPFMQSMFAVRPHELTDPTEQPKKRGWKCEFLSWLTTKFHTTKTT